MARQKTVVVTLTEWEYQPVLVKNKSDSRKKGKQSGNKVRHLLTARRVEEKDAMPATNDRKGERERTKENAGKWHNTS